VRILVAHDVNPTRTGGMSRIMGFLHDEIAAQGHEVEYFCAPDSPAPRFHRGLRRFSFPMAVLRHAQAGARRGRPYDIINVHEPSGAAVAAFRGGLGGARVVVTSHGIERRGWNLRLSPDGDPDDRPSAKTRTLYPATLLWQANLALRKADHVFCLNYEDRRYVAQHFHRDLNSITRIFPAADPVFGKRAAVREYGKATTILFAGTWLVRKGIRDLAPAFARLARSRQDLRLKVLNPGVDSRTVLRDFAEECRSQVECISAQPEAGTAGAMENADIFILPSRFEGTPLTLIEAMWSGLPLVSTAVCGMKDVIQHGSNGLLVDAGNAGALAGALEILLNDRDLRQRLGRQAHADAENRYRWSDAAAVVLRAYESLMQAEEGSKSPASSRSHAAEPPPARS
jgi:glycosyltransferase involved in cell wall biosynthesis